MWKIGFGRKMGLWIAAMALLVGSTMGPAMAQQPMACGERDSVLAQLKDKFQESPTGMGMTRAGAVMELMTSDEGSWTLMLSFPNGRTCLIATGDQWELWRSVVKGKDA